MGVSISVRLNGKQVTADVEPGMLLVQFLRERQRLTGTHVGCDTAQCGACTIHVNGRAVKSCNVLAVQVDGAEITTDTNPHDNNDEGNGLTGTSGGEYFVDEPSYIHVESAPLPAGTTDVRFRYSTDAAYVDTGFFVDDVTVGGQAATLSSSVTSSPAPPAK